MKAATVVKRLRRGIDRGDFTVHDIAASVARGADTVSNWIAGLNEPPSTVIPVIEAFLSARKEK